MAPLIVLAVLVGGAIVYGAYVVEQRRKRRAIAFAATVGMRIDVAKVDPPPIEFDLFRSGSGRKASYRLWHDGQPESVFAYQYTTSNGKNTQTHRFTCALLPTGLHAPHTKIGPEGFFSAIGRVVGIRDIEVESPAFNDRYRVTGNDERFAITLLDPAMINWLTTPAGTLGDARLELRDGWLMMIGDHMDIERYPGFLQWSTGFRANLPAVLRDLYPPRAS